MYYLLLLLPPLLFATSNLIDKKLTVGEEEDSSPASLMLVGGFFNLVIAIPIFIFLLYKGSFVFSWGLFLNGIIFTIAIWVYLKVLKNEDTDRAIVWYQTIPIFGLVGSWVFLSESLNIFSIVAIFLVIFGSIIMTTKDGVLRGKLMWLMLLSSLLISVNDVAFAYWGREINISSALFSDLIGKSAWALVFIFSPGAMRGFTKGLKTKLWLMSITETIFIAGDAIFDVAKLFFPVAIVQALASTQPVFVFIGALILNIFYPKFLMEIFDKKSLKNKIIGLIIVTIGGIILSRYMF